MWCDTHTHTDIFQWEQFWDAGTKAGPYGEVKMKTKTSCRSLDQSAKKEHFERFEIMHFGPLQNAKRVVVLNVWKTKIENELRPAG